MQRKVMWTGGTAEQKPQTSIHCVTLYSQSVNYPCSTFVFVNPLTNSKRMEIFFSSPHTATTLPFKLIADNANSLSHDHGQRDDE